ncbi:anthranilate synthase component II [Enterovibrio coralii]|uniref:Glutamine amidotransferase domain-containing protein n=1 Tax=Enterovibrio coralii TaxID=294935 RepID=A0A135I504_9GAMM|nr:aminodeoxychorismate/anthranilate synthase component II [Enterovibrio coralii]KXF80530.1 hypothetical protein ATN88_07540 [Enterovibrio coralii]
MIVIIDNYDSYVHNLAQAFGIHCDSIKIFKNDQVSIEELEQLPIKLLVISPGPGKPEDAGISLDLVQHFSGKLPIFGVCLGLQCIGVSHGGLLTHAKRPMHGKLSRIVHNAKGVFEKLKNELFVVRYNSLIISNDIDAQPDIDVTAVSDDGEVMAISVVGQPTHAVQFHPESFNTEAGKQLIDNMYQITKAFWTQHAD